MLASACGSEAEPTAAPAVRETEPPPKSPPTAKAPSAPEDPFAGARSLRLVRSTGVHAAPNRDAGRLGTIARDIRVAYRQVAAGPDCERVWVEIEPRGWVCGSNFEASDRAPRGVELPKVPRGQLVPGVYGKVVAARRAARTDAEPAGESAADTDSEGERDTRRADLATVWSDIDSPDGRVAKRPLVGSVTVRRYGEAEADGVSYWRIGKNEFVDARGIRPHEPSTWSGARLGDGTGQTLPLGFAVHRQRRTAAVPILDAPGGKRVGRLRARAAVPVLETLSDTDGRAVAHRIGDGRWVDAADLRVARPQPRPAGVGDSERWVDVDLDTQLVVAYEGDLPVYATLTSSGARKHPSRTGIFRVWIKFAETDMTGSMAAESNRAGDSGAYSVATVPWTQFYFKDLAFHTSYWHDDFGEPKSHGCLNLSPIDARWLYFFTDPQVPPGWSMAHGSVTHPGSAVRVRSADDPNPAFTGYAKRVHEARAAR